MHGTLDAADHLDARQFLIAVGKLADALAHGTDRSPFLASGIEYARSRRRCRRCGCWRGGTTWW